jgi:hypothetical protein
MQLKDKQSMQENLTQGRIHKKNYHQPRLLVYGNILELTHNLASSKGNDNSMSANDKSR